MLLFLLPPALAADPSASGDQQLVQLAVTTCSWQSPSLPPRVLRRSLLAGPGRVLHDAPWAARELTEHGCEGEAALLNALRAKSVGDSTTAWQSYEACAEHAVSWPVRAACANRAWLELTIAPVHVSGYTGLDRIREHLGEFRCAAGLLPSEERASLEVTLSTLEESPGVPEGR